MNQPMGEGHVFIPNLQPCTFFLRIRIRSWIRRLILKSILGHENDPQDHGCARLGILSTSISINGTDFA